MVAITSLLTGFIVALAAKGREMAATTALALVLCTLTVTGSLVMMIMTGKSPFLWIFLWQCAGWFAIVAGGAFVRTRRSVSAPRSTSG